MTDYQILCLSVWIMMNFAVASLFIFLTRTVLRYEEFRKGLVQGIQDNDHAFHWVDIKNVVYLLCGLVSADFTMNVTGIFVYNKMFETGPIAVIVIFASVTFALLGIAWKKP